MKRSLPSGSLRRVAGAACLAALLLCLTPAGAWALPDGRGWEMVSPVDKNGGSIAAPGGVFGGGVFQATPDGAAVTYSSAASFATPAQSAPPGSQYISGRGGSGWTTANLNVPIFSGSYGVVPEGVPYQLFSTDLLRGLLLSGSHCRSAEAACPVANPPLSGTDAPVGYQNYYQRGPVGFEALLGAGDVANTELDAANFGVRLAGASPDLATAVLETCAALTPDATEVPLGEGCDPAEQNLYRWRGGALTLLNLAPGAELAASGGAVSSEGRVYWRDLGDGNLYLTDGTQTKQVDAAVGGGGAFQAASATGSIVYFSKGGHLYRYQVANETTVDITPAGGVVGVLGASESGASVYYLAADGLYLWAGTTIAFPTAVANASAADPSNFPPATGTARVSNDGTRLAFVSSAPLTGYNNIDQTTGLPDPQVFLFSSAPRLVRCLSCRANASPPAGASSIPGAYANGGTHAYKPRALSTAGNRVFFESLDALVSEDTNHQPDVYQWEAQDSGTCTKSTGCVELISSGRASEGARFVDASLNGDDAFFVTNGSLVASDPGAVDLYDARVGGGFPESSPPIPCIGDACQSLPSPPVEPALNTLLTGPGNPKVHYFKYPRPRRHCRGAAKKRDKKCAKKQHKAHKGGRR